MAPEADARRNTAMHSTAHYFLDALNETGIEYLFCNFGTDHAPIIEEIARWSAMSDAERARVLAELPGRRQQPAAG